MSTSTALPQIDETLLATTRYLQALTVLDDESVRRPSLLPGWSRAHVVAHLSRNADAFTRVLGQVAAGEPASMYASAEARDADIADTVERLDLAGLVEDALASTARLTEALWACAADPDTPYTRVPGADRSFPLHTVGTAAPGRGGDPPRRPRHRLHSRRLAGGLLLAPGQAAAGRAGRSAGGPSMVLRSTDVDGLWKFGEGQGPEIHGSVGDLAWWLVGRGGGAGSAPAAPASSRSWGGGG